eukprot:Gb_26754 [translate_table: standard]
MHLMTMVEVVKPKWYERPFVLIVQGVLFNALFLLYLASPKLVHRILGYLKEEAILGFLPTTPSIPTFLKDLDNGNIKNMATPYIAVDY